MGNNVNILHSGTRQEEEFIEYLERCNNFHGISSVALNYKKYQNHQSKETLILNEALRLKKLKSPLIVLLSKQFFDLIWATASKPALLKVIASYSTRQCVHVWLDIDEFYVKRRSKALLRNDGYFRRTTNEELNSVSPSEVFKKLKDLMTPAAPPPTAPLNNLGIDDEEAEMKRYFLENHPNFLRSTEKVFPKNVKKKSGNVYTNALRHTTATENERIVSVNQRFGGSYNMGNGLNENPSSNKKKKYEKGKGEMNKINMLNDIRETEKNQIAYYLDKGYGANWKQLAQSFSIDKHFIQQVDASHFKGSQTKAVIEMLYTLKPDLELEEFMKKCHQIGRMDVASYISQNIIKNI